MTALDHRLYGWLIEADERRFRRAFDAYFKLAFPAVVRHLSRVSRWDVAPLEDLAQDALLRFFERVGRARHEAADSIQNALPSIVPLSLGPVHERQVRSWSSDVSSFKHAATHFEPPQAEDSNDLEWKTRIRSLADRIPLLQSSGRCLIEDAGVALRWCVDEPEGDGSVTFADRVVAELVTGTHRASIAERSLPGVTRFATGVMEITAALPRLRVPTNAFLFEIAMSLYLDECKRRARRKRGGAGVPIVASRNGSPSPAVSADYSGTLFSDHPEAELDGDNRFDEVSDLSLVHAPSSEHSVPAIDPTPHYEHEQFFEKFYEYLRRPVDEATAAFANADTESDASAARRSLETISRKFSRTISVLAMIGEGHTQEQTAERLGLSRNQVKYIIELVKDAYACFVEKSETALTRFADGGVQPRAS